MRINYNVSGMLANNALANSDNLLAKSLERLSSGLKINHAKDNPSGLAMAKRMNAQLAGLSMANQNAGDGVSVIEIADGAISEVHEMLQRLNELVLQGAHGPLTDEDREMIQEEVLQLKEEITRIAKDTEFNGQPLLNGGFDLKGYVTTGDVNADHLNVKVATYSPDVPAGQYTVSGIALAAETDVNGQPTGNYLLENADNLTVLKEDGTPVEVKASYRDNLLTMTGKDGFEMVLDLAIPVQKAGGAAVTVDDLGVDITGIGEMRLQIGSNEGQVIEAAIPGISLRNLGIEKLSVATQEEAAAGIDSVKGAIKFASKVRARLGAYQNRLESAIDSLNVVSENMTAAYSRIMDTDMAEEMTQYTTYQVLTQAGTSMLAQANERPAQVLQLLQ